MIQIDSLTRIQHCRPGWQQDWELFAEALIARMELKSRRYRWPSEYDRQDFISEMSVFYQRRANEGQLLSGWDDSRGSALDYLTGRLFDGRARQFLQELSIARSKTIPLVTENDEGRQTTYEPPARRKSSGSARVLRVDLERLRLALPDSGEMTRVTELAAIELFPRLDWNAPRMPQLRQHLEERLGSAECGAGALDALRRLHEQKQREYDAEDQRLYEQQENSRSGDSGQAQLLQRRIDKLRAERIFRPLDALALCELLAITRANADQLLKRYMDSLSELLPDAAAAFERLTGQASQPQPRLRLAHARARTFMPNCQKSFNEAYTA
ncbi:MAG TPA: hypothetical protein VEK08_01530 [Planctomycetota bacterium]|nr:hypothetical protein [Planctomycetota bacterium]